jgi:hypothetical protein
MTRVRSESPTFAGPAAFWQAFQMNGATDSPFVGNSLSYAGLILNA